METLYGLPFAALEIPNIKVKKPSWLQAPSAMTTFSLVFFLYFLVAGGIFFDILAEPPSIGSKKDERGHVRLEVFMPNRNGQYIMEGLASGFLFCLGGIGFILLDSAHYPSIPKRTRILLVSMAFVFILLSFFTTWVFITMKIPGYAIFYHIIGCLEEIAFLAIRPLPLFIVFVFKYNCIVLKYDRGWKNWPL